MNDMLNEMLINDSGEVIGQRPLTVEQKQRELNILQQQQEQEEKKKKDSPYRNFLQVNRDRVSVLRKLAKENAVALDLFLFLTEHMDKYNAVACSYAVLTEQLDKSRATVSRAVKYLRSNGILYVYKSGTTNVYVTNPEIVWRSWGTNLKYCKFPANVLLSKSENEKQMQMQQQWINQIQKQQN